MASQDIFVVEKLFCCRKRGSKFWRSRVAAKKCTFAVANLYFQLQMYTLPKQNFTAAAVEMLQQLPVTHV